MQIPFCWHRPIVGDFARDASDTCNAVVEFESGASCNLTLNFYPTQAGPRAGSISFNYTTPQGSGNYSITLNATGLPVATTTSLSISTAGTIKYKTSVALTVSVSPNSAGIVSKFSTDAEDKKRPMDGWIHLEEFCIV